LLELQIRLKLIIITELGLILLKRLVWLKKSMKAREVKRAKTVDKIWLKKRKALKEAG